MALFPMNDFVRKYSGTGIPCMVYKALARSCRSGKVLVLRVLALGSFQILMFLNVYSVLIDLLLLSFIC